MKPLFSKVDMDLAYAYGKNDASMKEYRELISSLTRRNKEKNNVDC